MSIGIDFGTTNSVAAVYDKRIKKTRALTEQTTNLPHPSVVWFRGNEVIVGREAKQNLGFAQVAGNHFERSIKRKLGQNQIVSVFGERKRPHEVAAEIFRFLKSQGEREHGIKIEEAVVTIPVHFKGEARRELRKAADEAGISIKTFIHEPFAAVIGYCYVAERDIVGLQEANVLVFDWGGGTLDITIAKVEGSYITEVATGGLDDIAGDLFDRRIQTSAEGKFLDKYSLRPETLSTLRPGTRDRLNVESEKTKITLSSEESASVQVADFLQRDSHVFDLDVQFSRSTFQEKIRSDINSALAEMDRVLSEARLRHSEIDQVLLIGGSSKIPLVRSEMQKRFGVRVIEVENADTIIAEGASIVSYNDWQPFLSRPVQILLSDESFYTAFEEGTPLNPLTCRKKINMFCTDNRDGEARLVLAERLRAGDETSIRTKEVLNIPVSPHLPSPYNHERVEVTFQVDENLILKVEAHSAIEQQVKRTEIFDLTFGLRVA